MWNGLVMPEDRSGERYLLVGLGRGLGCMPSVTESVKPVLSRVLGALQHGRDAGEPTSQVLKQMMRPHVFARENQQSNKNEQHALHHGQKKANDPGDDEKPPDNDQADAFYLLFHLWVDWMRFSLQRGNFYIVKLTIC